MGSRFAMVMCAVVLTCSLAACKKKAAATDASQDLAAVASANAALELAPKLPAPPQLLVIDGDETEGSSPLDALLPIKAPRLLMLPFGQTAPVAPRDRQPFTSMFKPFKTASFLHAIAFLFNPTNVSTTTSVTASAFTRRLAEEFPLDVLLAEDNAVNQKVALRFLERVAMDFGFVQRAVEAAIQIVEQLRARVVPRPLADAIARVDRGLAGPRLSAEICAPSLLPCADGAREILTMSVRTRESTEIHAVADGHARHEERHQARRNSFRFRHHLGRLGKHRVDPGET